MPPASSGTLLLNDEQRLQWLRLIRSEGVGPRTFRGLVNHFGGAGAALDALPDLARSRGRGSIKVASLADVEREMDAARRKGVRFVATGEGDYPRNLSAIDSAPPLIAIRGNSKALSAPSVAIVGSRNASAAGLQMAQRLARDLSEAGFVIVSGLARGIDAVAHKASLSRGTVAVLGGGHDRIYPAEHEGLLEAMLEQGAVVSEMPMGWEPRGRDFPRRNRIVSGMASGVVLVEAARRSGSLITARFALEQGREVLAVPGSPLDPRAEGTNDLIRQGATLITCAQDVLEVLLPLVEQRGAGRGAMSEGVPDADTEPLWDDYDFLSESPQSSALPNASDVTRWTEPDVDIGTGASDPTRSIIGLLGPTPVSVDELARASSFNIRIVQLVLFELEQAGRLERHGAALVSLRPVG